MRKELGIAEEEKREFRVVKDEERRENRERRKNYNERLEGVSEDKG